MALYPVGTVWPVALGVSEASWEDEYRACFPQLYRGLVALGARPEEAEDALRDAFVRLLEAAEVRWATGWLFVVALRRWRRRRWRNRIIRPLLGSVRTEEPPTELRIDLFDALRKLTPRLREVLVARYIVGLSDEEIARALGIAGGTVAATSTHATKALRSLMAGTSTNEELELLTMREFDDAAARVTLPPRNRWIPRERTRTGTKVAATLALAALVLVGIVVVFAERSRTGVGEPPKTPSPTFSRNDSGTHLPTEAEVWGEIWSQAKGIAVLRPTWLPKSTDEYQIFPVVRTSSDGFFRYDVSYTALHSVSVVWNVEFFADSLETQGGGLIQFGGVPETVAVRGHAAMLTGNGSPGWVLVWSEGNYRYAMQAFAIGREDLLHIANSLAPVIDDTGRTGP